MNEGLKAIAACHIPQFDLRRQYWCNRREQRVRFDESHTPFRRSRKTVFNFKQYHRRRQEWRQANIKGTCRNIASIRSADQGPVQTFVFRSSQIGPLAQYQTQEDISSVRKKAHRLCDRLFVDSPRTVRRHNAYSTPARPVPRIGHRI